MRTILALALILLAPASALADQNAADACATGLSAAPKQIYEGTLAENPTAATARDIVVAQTKKLVSAGKLSMGDARSAGQAAGNCVKMLFE